MAGLGVATGVVGVFAVVVGMEDVLFFEPQERMTPLNVRAKATERSFFMPPCDATLEPLKV